MWRRSHSAWSSEIGGISASGRECGVLNAYRKLIKLDGEVAQLRAGRVDACSAGKLPQKGGVVAVSGGALFGGCGHGN